MTAATNEQIGAYKTHQRQSESEREIESRALLSCANQLDAAQKSSDRNFYTDALKRNQRLWTIFQVALCDPDNPLPKELKITLLNLSRYIDRVSFRAIAEYMPAALSSLIDINRSIATGLSKQPKENAVTTPPPEAPPSPGLRTTA